MPDSTFASMIAAPPLSPPRRPNPIECVAHSTRSHPYAAVTSSPSGRRYRHYCIWRCGQPCLLHPFCCYARDWHARPAGQNETWDLSVRNNRHLDPPRCWYRLAMAVEINEAKNFFEISSSLSCWMSAMSSFLSFPSVLHWFLLCSVSP